MTTTGPSSAPQHQSSPNQRKRRKIFLLRGTLIFALGALIIDHRGFEFLGVGPLLLVLGFALSNAVVPLVPLRAINSLRFSLFLGAADVAVIAVGLAMAGALDVLPVTCLLMVLVVALSNYTVRAVAGAAAVGAVHSWVVLDVRPTLDTGWQLAVQVLFLCSIALYYGFLVRDLHRNRRRAEAESLERHELATLVRILESVTSSLDVREVTRTIVAQMDEVVPGIRCSLLYIDEGSERCHVLASSDDPNVDHLELDLSKYPEVRRALETRQPVMIRDVASDPMMAEVRAVLDSLDFQSIMVVPLTFGEDLLGTLFLKTARSGREFSRSELVFVTAVARASANALKNALLHREVQATSNHHRRLHGKLERLLDHSPDVILSTDTEGCITELNRGLVEKLGVPREELIGRSFRTLFEPGTEDDLVERVIADGVIAEHACRLRGRDRRMLNVQLYLSTLVDENNVTLGTFWIGRDVTELKSAQQQLLQAEKLSTIGNVISGVAHELNNPLSVVLGFSQLLMARRPDDPSLRDLNRVNDAALRCQKIVKNLLSFARMHKPERSLGCLNRAIEETLELKKYQLRVQNIDVACELDPDLPETHVDFHQIQQVVLNLITNAEHAMAASRERSGRLTLRSRRAGERLFIEVEDNGEGMSQATLDKIFDPFFSTKEPGLGTGLGLSVSYGILGEHAGSIRAESELGRGTRFTLELPLLTEETGTVEDEIASVTSPSPVDRRILVVDDERMIAELLCRVIEQLGHKADLAHDGHEALSMAEQAEYDMVITDVRMPRVNGIELYRELTTRQPDLARNVVFTTGDLIDAETADFLAQVDAPVLPKPFEIQTVRQAILQTLSSDTKDRQPS